MSDETLIALTADIVAAHVGSNNVSITDLPALIGSVHKALAGLGTVAEPEPARQEPAVSVRASIKPDYVVCLEDGKKLKMLKRHLMTHYQLTPDQYRAKWNLPADYPMVAPNYAATRKALALKIGLGRKPKAAPAPAPVKRGRKAKAAPTE
jgi:predicted transcriptional regulator